MIPLHGLDDALAAIEAAAFVGANRPSLAPVLRPGDVVTPTLVTEAKAKAALAEHGVIAPRAAICAGGDARAIARGGGRL